MASRIITAGLLLLCLSACARAQTCYVANQQANIRSKASICSGAKGSVNQGDIIKVTDSPQQECYNWGQTVVVSGGLQGTQGYTNLDAYSQTSCPGPPPNPNGPCKNTGEQCNYASDCCQPGSGPAVTCDGSPKKCSGGAIVTSSAPVP
ncbi:hypothetical protein D9Q98_000086 [Chlorella vulgaris]|uniref:Uncharacterized protein n=1 Tax=Chlorella vulgaris TaxID=3077 RepID=A0A9D4Z182_CHLVU|nr:hypothetical protein D9Q98_000086 [Chlorella vulgaris]